MVSFGRFADGILRYVFAARFENTLTLQMSRGSLYIALESLLYIP